MTIASEITRINGNIAAAYTAANNKGATMPATQNSANLATCIGTISTGTTPVIQSLNVTPTTSAQTITASGGVDGYSPINVSAVTSSIDANITAANIKDGVTILGVTGNYTGTTPTGTISITSNGIYDVTNYASASVSVSGGGAKYGANVNTMLGDIDANGVLQSPTEQSDLVFTGVKDCAAKMRYRFAFTNVKSASFPDLTSVSTQEAFNWMFSNCTNLTTVSLPKLATVSAMSACGRMFNECTNLTSVSLPELTTVSGQNGCSYMFYGCNSITSVSLPELTTISGNSGCSYMFQLCRNLTTLSFPKLSNIAINAVFTNALLSCYKIENVYFNALTTTSFGNSTNQFSNMMAQTGNTVIHTLHFPSNLQSTIQGLTGYPLFGGTSGYVTLSFDLTATS